MDHGNIEYFMTYGFHNPETQQFVILDDKQQLRHFLRTLGHKDCIFRIGLDQMYFSPRITIPESLKSKIIEASFVLKNLNLSSKKALEIFQRFAEER